MGIDKHVIKRALDIGAAAAGLVVTAPVQLATAAVIRATMGSPVLFRQQRPGRDGRVFTMVKFRTMLSVDESQGRFDDAQRLTKVGQFLRSTSLDELPELWSVLRGDMSLVGPRPLLVEYLEHYSPEQARRHEVRPGLTGLAQVSGRNATSWQERLALDVRYVDTWTIGGDLEILWRTLTTVVRRDGISAEGSATMERFAGGPTDGQDRSAPGSL